MPLLPITLCWLALVASEAATVWVDQLHGHDFETCGSLPATACASIRQAVRLANESDVVAVVPSMVYSSDQCGIAVSRNILITSSAWPDTPVIMDCSGRSAFRFTNCAMHLRGLHIRNARAVGVEHAAAVSAVVNVLLAGLMPTIEGCVFSNCTAAGSLTSAGAVGIIYQQAGIHPQQGLVIRNCSFLSNVGQVASFGYAGAVLLLVGDAATASTFGSVTVEYSRFHKNSATGRGDVPRGVAAGAVGVLVWRGGNDNAVVLRGCFFTANSADGMQTTSLASASAGAVAIGFLCASDAPVVCRSSNMANLCTLIDCGFVGNGVSTSIDPATTVNALVFAGAVAVAHLAVGGGAEVVNEGNVVSITRCVFQSNRLSLTPMDGELGTVASGAVSVAFLVGAYHYRDAVVRSVNNGNGVEVVDSQWTDNMAGGSLIAYVHLTVAGALAVAHGVVSWASSSGATYAVVAQANSRNAIGFHNCSFRFNQGGTGHRPHPSGSDTALASLSGAVSITQAVNIFNQMPAISLANCDNTFRVWQCHFASNSGGSENAILGLAAAGALSFLSATSPAWGAAAFGADHSSAFDSVWVTNTVFAHNNGGSGNAPGMFVTPISATAAGVAMAYISQPSNQRASNRGHAIRFSGCQFVQNIAWPTAKDDPSQSAAALSILLSVPGAGADSNVDNAVAISGLKALDNRGGVTLSVMFVGHSASLNNSVAVRDTLVANNVALKTGAVNVQGATAGVSRCHFQSNTGAGPGALSIAAEPSSGAAARLQQTSFLSNRAVASAFTQGNVVAGALLLRGHHVIAQGLSFINNSAVDDAGALLVDGQSNLTCVQCHFALNSARSSAMDIAWQSIGSLALVHSSIQVRLVHGQPSATSVELRFARSSFALHNASVTCPTGSIFFSEEHSFGCRFCPVSTYSIGEYAWHSGELQRQCRACPLAGDCSAGRDQVRALSGHWGALINDSIAGPLISFAVCPPDYCCDAPNCVFNYCRDNRQGLLCGECSPGFSQALNSAACVPDASCTDAGWLFVVLLALGFVVAAVLLLTPLHSTGWLSVIVNYMQIAPLLFVENAVPFLQTLAGVFDIKLAVAHPICPWAGLTTIQSELLNFASPVLVILPVLVLWFVLPRRLTLVVALVRAGMFTYSTVAKTTLTLLHCVDIEGASGHRLFLSAHQSCYAPWQNALFVLLALAWIAPFSLFILTWKSGREPQGGHQASWKLPPSVFQLLSSPYTSEARYWEAMMLGHRLLIITINTFINEPTWRAVVLAAVSQLVLAMQLVTRPFADLAVARLQVACLAALSVMAVIAIPAASALEWSATSFLASQSFVSTTNAIQSATFSAPILIAVILLLQRARAYTRQRRALRSRSGTDDASPATDDDIARTPSLAYAVPLLINQS